MPKPAEAPETLICTAKDCTQPRYDQKPDATNRHCRFHRNEAQRRWTLSRMQQEKGKGFYSGVQALRDLLVKEFLEQGSGRFDGVEIAALIFNAPGPRMPGEENAPV